MFKKKYLAILAPYNSVNSLITTHSYALKKFSENFSKVYYINSEKLNFFPRTFLHNLEEIKNWLPKNFELFNPQNSKEFKKFLSDKNLIVINMFGRYFPSIKIHYLLKKFKIKQVQITNVGQINWTQTTDNKYFLKTIMYKIKKIGPIVTLLLANLGLIAKIEIRFLSNKVYLKNIKKSKIKNFLYNKKFFYAKEIVEINSIANDIFLSQKEIISEDYIVHLDYNLNHYHETQLRGVMPQEKINEHYFYLEKVLKRLSNTFDKKVKVCIHPAYNIKDHQKNLPDFEIIQFRTREFIYKAFLVTLFDSSSVIDAVLLKKKIIGLTSDIMGLNGAKQSHAYSNIIGYLNLNTKNEIKEKNDLLDIMKNNIKNYDNYINNYISFDPNKIGLDRVVNVIKEKYFND
jgi:hypothetical protein